MSLTGKIPFRAWFPFWVAGAVGVIMGLFLPWWFVFPTVALHIFMAAATAQLGTVRIEVTADLTLVVPAGQGDFIRAELAKYGKAQRKR